MIGNDDGIRQNPHGPAVGTVFLDQHPGGSGAFQFGGYLNHPLWLNPVSTVSPWTTRGLRVLGAFFPF
jgi:hypothetical protein